MSSPLDSPQQGEGRACKGGRGRDVTNAHVPEKLAVHVQRPLGLGVDPTSA